MVIYGEYLFLENAISGYIIIMLAMQLIEKTPLKSRILLGTVLSGIVSFTLFLNLNIFFSVILKICCCIFITICVFGIDMLIKRTIVVLGITYFLGGISLAFLFLINYVGISNNGNIYIESPKYHMILLLLFLGGVFINSIISMAKKNRKEIEFYRNIIIVINKKKYNAKALIDSGNNVREPISSAYVAFVSERLEKEICQSLDEIERNRRFCLIPFNTVGNHKGFMEGLRIEELDIDGIKYRNAIIGFSKNNFNDCFDVLLNKDMLRGSVI